MGDASDSTAAASAGEHKDLRTIARKYQLDLSSAASGIEMAGSPVLGGRGRGGAAGATPIPVAAGVVSPSVPGGHGRRRNASRARRLVAAGATPVTVATTVAIASPLVEVADDGQGGVKARMPQVDNPSQSEIETLLKKLRKINSELQTWITAKASEFLSYKLSHRSQILRHLGQAKMLEAKLSYQVTQKKLESEIEMSLQLLHQKVSSEMPTWVSSKGTNFLSHTLTCQMETLQKMAQELYNLRSSHGANCQNGSLIDSKNQDLLQEETAVAMSAGQDYLPNQQYTQPSNERKRKSIKIHDIPFEVYRVLVNPRKKIYAHRIGKSANVAKVQEDTGSFPYVNFKRERVNNRHAYYIMAFVCHINILRLTRICDDKSSTTEKSLVAFVEPVKGTLASLCPLRACMDSYGFIPTERCRVTFREIILGLWFLWRNGLYHGNLNWSTTYYSHTSSVKLANFEIQESASLEEAWIIDRNSLVGMLHVIANKAANLYPDCSRDLINSLIDTISAIDMGSPIGLETTILDNSFFWTRCQRTDFFATTISIKLRDVEFVNNLPSYLCILPWTTSYGKQFLELVNDMNAYRRGTRNWSPYNKQSVEHFVSCICGAYAHKETLKVKDVDGIVTRAVPLLVEKLRRLI